MVSIASAYNAEQSLQALQILRGEIEKVEKSEFSKVNSRSIWIQGFLYLQSVQNFDEDYDSFIDCKRVKGRIIWKDFYSNEREFALITYRGDL